MQSWTELHCFIWIRYLLYWIYHKLTYIQEIIKWRRNSRILDSNFVSRTTTTLVMFLLPKKIEKLLYNLNHTQNLCHFRISIGYYVSVILGILQVFYSTYDYFYCIHFNTCAHDEWGIWEENGKCIRMGGTFIWHCFRQLQIELPFVVCNNCFVFGE